MNFAAAFDSCNRAAVIQHPSILHDRPGARRGSSRTRMRFVLACCHCETPVRGVRSHCYYRIVRPFE